MSIIVPPRGPCPAEIMVVGEAPGTSEEVAGKPFVGASGQELERMLREAGFNPANIFFTTVCRIRPPSNDISNYFGSKKDDNCFFTMGRYARQPILDGLELLRQEITNVQPNLIIAVGDTALWGLTGLSGISKWRGSELSATGTNHPDKLVIPTYAPAAVLRMWDWRNIVVHDLRRAKRIHTYGQTRRDYNFILRPSFEQANAALDLFLRMVANGPARFSIDLETRHKHIACIGIATSEVDAICIPFLCMERTTGYWSFEEEVELIWKIKLLLTHPNAVIVGQNYMYDIQYMARRWKFLSRCYMDTMLTHHVCFPGTPKALDYLSSMYCAQHVYWKDEGKEWRQDMVEDRLWQYNCLDAVRTWEISMVLDKVVDQMDIRKQFEFQMEIFWPLVKMMLRGVAVDLAYKQRLSGELAQAFNERQHFLNQCVGGDINIRSPKQMQKLLYEALRLPVQRHPKTKQPTTNDEALVNLQIKAVPCVRVVLETIREMRSLGVFASTFVDAELSEDARARCSYNVAGTETFRLSSSTDAFGTGLNLQNIPSGG